MAEAEGEDSGISRMSISGLFDERGNPAALASGWLQQADKTGRKRHRYFCLTPTYLAYFHDEADSAITESGFMLGDSDHTSLSSFANHGACVMCQNIYAAEAHDTSPMFTLVLKQGLEDGTQAMELYAANADIAKGWSDAINSQKEKYKDVRAPARQPREVVPSAAPTAAAAIAAVTMMVGGTKASGSLFGSLFGASSEPMRPDNDYDVCTPWEVKGIDLTLPSTKSCLEDEHGHSATVVHGWLTKKNKSGIYAGSVEKERYFVLTPRHLCYFDSQEAADVRNGYMWGKAEGDKIGGLFTKTGAKLPLEAVCEVRLLSKESNSKHVASPKGKGKGGRSTDDDEDSDDDTPKRPSKPKPTSTKPQGSKPPGSKPMGDKPTGEKNSKPVKPEGPAPSNLLEIDFGEYSLIVNAHNQKCRTQWVHALRKWSGLRKRQVDEELFTGGSIF